MPIINPSVVQSLWIGEKFSTMEHLACASFLQNGHTFHLYVYHEVANVPAGVILKDANEIIPVSRIFKYKDYDSYAGFSNLFRYKLLLEKGGYWVDTDLVCLKPFPEGSQYIFAGETNAKSLRSTRRSFHHVASCLIKTPPGSEIMDYCYHEAAKRDPTKLHWGETGPCLMTAAVQKFRMRPHVSPPHFFCPVSPQQWKQLITGLSVGNVGMATIACYNPYAVHLWHEQWRRQKLDPNTVFSRSSIYEQLKQRYIQNMSVG